MEDENFVEEEQQQQLSTIFREQFQSEDIQQYHQTYLDELRQKLSQWQLETDRKIRQFIDDKNEEINQLRDQYAQDFNHKYEEIRQQIENLGSQADINEQLENFQCFCQTNTIDKCIQLNSQDFSINQIADNLQFEYNLDRNPIVERKIVEPRTSERSESPVEQEIEDSPSLAIKRKSIEPLGSSDVEEKTASPSFVIRKRTIDPPESPYATRRSVSPEPINRRKTTNQSDSSIENQTNQSPEVVDSPKPVIQKQTVERDSSPESIVTTRRQTNEPSESPKPVVQRTNEPVDSSPESIVNKRLREPSETIIPKRPDSIHSSQTSSNASPVPASKDHSYDHVQMNRYLLKPEPSPSKKDSCIPLRMSSPVTTRTAKQSKAPPRIFVGKQEILTPVLVGKDREVYNSTEKITEYSIDSIPIPKDKIDQTTTAGDTDEMRIVHAYKVLIEQENSFQTTSISASVSSSSSSSSDDDNDEALVYTTNQFDLKKYDQVNYSTMMFRKCETDYNCMSSSTRRNELIIYNSKLKVLMILQHEQRQQCRNRFYLYWPKTLAPCISDITYCSATDHFLLSAWDSCQLYLFNRELLTVTDLGRICSESPLRRIHVYRQVLYCIISNNYLYEYTCDKQYSNIQLHYKIKLYNPETLSQDVVYHLLDVACDENFLVILYSNEHDEIHLQSLHRQTKDFHRDLLIDIGNPINQNYIRIESTQSKGKYVYLNGSHKHLKSIDLINSRKGKITRTIPRQVTPTNISFLQDQRLVILYEHPHYLSVHDLNIHN
mgnify:FL=1